MYRSIANGLIGKILLINLRIELNLLVNKFNYPYLTKELV